MTALCFQTFSLHLSLRLLLAVSQSAFGDPDRRTMTADVPQYQTNLIK